MAMLNNQRVYTKTHSFSSPFALKSKHGRFFGNYIQLQDSAVFVVQIWTLPDFVLWTLDCLFSSVPIQCRVYSSFLLTSLVWDTQFFKKKWSIN